MQDGAAAALSEAQRRKENDLDQVHARVRQTIQRKDGIIEALKERLEEAEVRAAQAEKLLDRQRLELVGE